MLGTGPLCAGHWAQRWSVPALEQSWASAGMQEETDDKKQGASTFTCIQKVLPSSKQKPVIINIQIPDGSNTKGGTGPTCIAVGPSCVKIGLEVSLAPKSRLPRSMADLSACSPHPVLRLLLPPLGWQLPIQASLPPLHR